jgi:Phage tail assembly chaperone protein
MGALYYNPDTGRILRYCSAPQPDELDALPAGTQCLESPFVDVGAAYVLDGKVVVIPKRPSDMHLFDWDAKVWVDQMTPAIKWAEVRGRRNYLLLETDWTHLPDTPLAAQSKQAWAQYRQALRDITAQSDPFHIVWPTPPA